MTTPKEERPKPNKGDRTIGDPGEGETTVEEGPEAPPRKAEETGRGMITGGAAGRDP